MTGAAGQGGGTAFMSPSAVHLMREQFYGGSSSAAVRASRGRVCSYADPDVVKAAKREALDFKIRMKMADPAAAASHTAALRQLSSQKTTLDLSFLTSPLAGQPGSQDQVKSLVMPPEVGEHGDEISGSSKVILSGKRMDYQRVDSAAGEGRGQAAALGYHALDVEVPAAKPAGRPAWEVGKARGSTTASEFTGPMWSQLQEGMMAYIPVKIMRPDGMAGTAFMSQSQAIEAARTELNSSRTPRPQSATLKRYGAPPPADGERRTSTGSRGGSGGGAAPAAAATSSGLALDKFKDVPLPMAQVQEIDLFAMYRARSQRLLQKQLAAAPAPHPRPTDSSASQEPLRATVCSSSSGGGSGKAGTAACALSPRTTAAAAAAEAALGLAAAPPAAAGPHGRSSSAARARPPSGAAAKPANGPQPGTAAATEPAKASSSAAHGQPQQQQRPGQGAAAPQDPTAAGSASTPRAVVSALKQARPQSARPAAAGGGGGSVRAGPSVAWAPEPAQHLGTAPTAARPGAGWGGAHAAGPAQAIAPLQMQPGPAAAYPGAGPTGARPQPAQGPPLRRALSSGSATPAAPAQPQGTGAPGSAPGMRVQYQPPGPEARREQQRRPGSAVHTSKTNSRTRGGLLGEFSSSFSEQQQHGDREMLQNRILQYTAQQYVLEGKELLKALAAGGNADVPGARGTVGMSAADATASLATMQRSVGAACGPDGQQADGSVHLRRPCSAPSKRVRPPSAGNWAGRPPPEAVLSATPTPRRSPSFPAGALYDPAVQA